MLKRGIRWALVIEAIVYLAIGWCLYVQGWSILGLISSAVVLFFALRLLIVLFSFLLSMACRSSRPRHLTVRGWPWLRALLLEWLMTLRWYSLWQAFPDRFVREPAPPTGDARPMPVLLVHGYLCNAAAWSFYQRWFQERGRPAYTISLEPVLGSIESMIDGLEHRIAEVLAASGASELDIVAHSMGGVVVRTLLRRRPHAKGIRGVVTLGSPHHGTMLARLAFGQCGHELRYESSWFKQLNDAQPAAPDLPGGFTSIYTYDDNLVAPQETSRFEGAENIGISGVGHASLLGSRAVFDMVVDRLAAGESGRAMQGMPSRL